MLGQGLLCIGVAEREGNEKLLVEGLPDKRRTDQAPKFSDADIFGELGSDEVVEDLVKWQVRECFQIGIV